MPIVLELIYAFDGHGDSWPWTELIVRYVPWELALAAYGALALWVPIHFYVRYRRKQKKALKERVEAGHKDVPLGLLKDAVSVMSPEEYERFKQDFLETCNRDTCPDPSTCYFHKNWVPE